MAFVIILLSLLTFSVPTFAVDNLRNSVLNLPLPNQEAFQHWERRHGEESSEVDPFQMEHVSFACDRPGYFPTHPQMSLKLYHTVMMGTYDHFRLQASSEACKLGAKVKNGQGFISCLLPDTLHYVLFSDTYQDACGNYFRGISEVLYLQQNENMGTLFSPGRAAYPKPGSPFEDEYEVGPTYPLTPASFLFLTKLFPGDAEEIARDKVSAEQSGLHWDSQTLLWKR